MNIKNKKAFTLLELMIVVLIIAILGVLAVPNFRGATIKAKFAEMFTIVGELERAIDFHVMANGWETRIDWRDYDSIPLGSLKYFQRGTADIYIAPYWNYEVIIYVKGISGMLCKRQIGSTGKSWMINTNHDWAKYLKISGATRTPL